MFKNYLKLTLRNLYREKLYALINIFGLSLGIACCIILGLYIENETSYDKHHDKADRLYRIVNEYTFSEVPSPFATSSRAVGPLLKLDNPDAIESYTRFRPDSRGRKTVFRHEADAYFWEDTFIADTNVFDVFNHDIIYGNPEGALVDAEALAVSETFARTYFGDANPIGEIVSTDVSQYHITLVFADLPDNSHLKYDVLFSINLTGVPTNNPAELQRMLVSPGDFTYLLMAEGFDPDDFGPMLDNFSDQRLGALVRERGADITAVFRAQKLTDVHFDSGWDRDRPTGNIIYIYGFAAVAIFILLVACINYVNLATARSMQRAKEVGMRKVLGARRQQLVLQFLGESLFFVVIALCIALLAVYVLIDYNLIDQMLGMQVNLASVFEPSLLLSLLGLSLLVGFLSGIYPAFYLSSAAPMAALSDSSKSTRTRSGRLRQLLVLLQFIISIGIISSTLLMANQMRFVADLSLGFDRENKLLVPLRGADVIESMQAIRNELVANPNILSASLSQQVPGDQIGSGAFTLEDQAGVTGLHVLSLMFMGEDFLQTMGVSLVEGRDFGQKLLTDVGRSVLVNQALVDKMGWDQALGKPILSDRAGTFARIIGVTEDFHFESLYRPVAPLLMLSPQLNFQGANSAQRAQANMTLVVNIVGNQISETLSFVQDIMLKFDPGHPFEYKFLDNHLNQLYQSEQSVMSLTSIFSAICVFISCLGLFGLAAFTTEQRTKEIGIRKVMGASGLQIVMLLSRHIVLLIVIAAIVASGVTYFVINQWLSSFAYQAAINPLTFILAASMALLVAVATVALQSIKTVRANPVIALRYE